MIRASAVKYSLLVLMLVALTGILVFGPPGLRAQNPPQKAAPAQSGSINNEDCAACHDDVVKAFDRNPHAILEKSKQYNLKNSCESCHGPGQAHMDGSGDKTKIVTFKEAEGRKYNETCLSCHKKNRELVAFNGSRHHKGALNCSDCHNIHSAARVTPLLKEAETSLCLRCHTERRGDFSKPYHHWVKEGAMKCSDCHQAHSGLVRRQVRNSTVGDAICTRCHTKTEGPFVDGHFEFQVSTAGLYEVVHETSDDCAPTTPSHRQVFIVRRPDGSLSGYSGIAFGCRAAGDVAIVVAGIVFEDMNRDGTYQAGEPGLADVLITGETPCPTFAPIQGRTDERGRYELRLPACPPPYVITRETLPGFVDTSPNPVIFPGLVPGPPIPVSPPPGTSVGVLHANFGVARADSSMESSVEGMVFEDVNRNGVYEDEDRGLPNVEVTAAGIFCMTPVIGVTRTDAMGRYVLRQSDVHCTLPWRVTHAALAGLCDTSPNPVDVGYDRRPDPRHYRVDFAVALCDSIPGDSRLVVFVHWQNQGLEGRRLEMLDLGAVRFTNSAGLAEFALPAGDHILRAYVNVGGPAGFTDVSVTTRQGDTTQVPQRWASLLTNGQLPKKPIYGEPFHR